MNRKDILTYLVSSRWFYWCRFSSSIMRSCHPMYHELITLNTLQSYNSLQYQMFYMVANWCDSSGYLKKDICLYPPLIVFNLFDVKSAKSKTVPLRRFSFFLVLHTVYYIERKLSTLTTHQSRDRKMNGCMSLQ